MWRPVDTLGDFPSSSVDRTLWVTLTPFNTEGMKWSANWELHLITQHQWETGPMIMGVDPCSRASTLQKSINWRRLWDTAKGSGRKEAEGDDRMI